MTQYLTFFLAGEEYAITILKVTEIIECAALTKVPGAPAWVRGVINLRGAVVPVIDLAVKFAMGETAITARTCVVIVEMRHDGERLVLGVMADAVNQVVDLGPGEIQPPPAFGPKVRVDCIEGMGSSNGKFVVLLDIDRVLSSSEVLAATEALDVTELALAAV
jgi:purine-binding chemotaxis protein CheW